MTKELRKRIWETRDNVNELIFEIEEIGDVLDKLTVRETLRDISELLSNIIQEIIQEGKNNEKNSKA
nr:MAG: hypothetical protein [Bacteriophage sp.]